KGFRRIALEPGETKTVTLTLPGRNLAYWDSTAATWVIENDRVELQVGASSADIRFKDTLVVTNGGPIDLSSAAAKPPSSCTGGSKAPAALAGVRLMRKGGSAVLLVRMSGSAVIDLCVYSLAGKVVYRVKRRILPAGKHIINLCGADPAAGVYLVAGQADNTAFSVKRCLR
ncbi:MAG: fibronectin type III-like domain-contianing protein, partial [Chitinispirillaceae bacterium]|nr:fibronectin type III-like domain-contianing protein [Chitinispirillaceae bacterium]